MMPTWKTQYEGVETMTLAVMGCIVNGPGESKAANIGISLPGTGEAPRCPVYIDGKKDVTLVGTFEGDVFLSVDVDGAARGFAGARKTDADVGGFGFTRAVDDTTHDGERHGFDAFVLRFPDGHHVADVALNAFRQFLESRAGGATTAGARGNAGRK